MNRMDTILTGGQVIDGSGSPAVQADVRISEAGEIVWVGDGPREGAAVLDVSGKTITPGFVDFHAHTDMTLLVNPTAESKISQGVTLEVNGNCGFSDAPIINPTARERAVEAWKRLGIDLNWSTMDQMLDTLKGAGTALNFCTFVGHANIRREVVGDEDRPATPEELHAMQHLVDEAMEEGAIGLSTGLIYPPSAFGTTDELVELCHPVAKRGGLYSTHMRSEAGQLLESVAEAIQIGERSGARIQISHLKACGQSNYGKTVQALEMIEQARQRGVDVTADQYPYVATCTGLDTIIPNWAHSGGTPAMRERLTNPETRERIYREISESASPGGYIHDSGGFESVVIAGVKTEEYKWAEGISMSQVASRMGKDQVNALLDFLLEEDFAVGMVHFCLSETDVKAVMQTPYTLFGSDATARACSGKMSEGHPHPRAFGTFPRILSYYVKDQNILTTTEAIRKMTSLACERLGYYDRGYVKPGYRADIVVFDSEKIRDKATFSDPKQLSAGIDYVLVNGVFAVKDGRITGSLPGTVL